MQKRADDATNARAAIVLRAVMRRLARMKEGTPYGQNTTGQRSRARPTSGT